MGKIDVVEKTETTLKVETINMYGEDIPITEHNKPLIDKMLALEEKLKTVKGTECEVYSRVVGYFRPVKHWNKGKVEEFKERKVFKLDRGVRDDTER